MLKAIESGYVKKEILNAAYEKQLQIEKKARIVVGVNAFRSAQRARLRTQALPESLQRARVLKLRQLKKGRDQGEIKERLERVKSSAQAGENLLPAISEAVKSGCTVGEISDALRAVYGVRRAPMPF